MWYVRCSASSGECPSWAFSRPPSSEQTGGTQKQQAQAEAYNPQSESGAINASSESISGFRVGGLIGVVFHIAWALLLYELLKPVNRSLPLLAVFVILVGCAIQALTSLLYLAPLLVLGGGSSLSAFTSEPLQALMFLRLNAYAFYSPQANL